MSRQSTFASTQTHAPAYDMVHLWYIMTETIGWFSSLVLLATISKQIYKQWQEESSQGVSKWLFIGQVVASAGFALYSYLVNNPVFVVTNLLMLLSAFVGLGITLWQRRSKAKHHSAEVRNA